MIGATSGDLTRKGIAAAAAGAGVGGGGGRQVQWGGTQGEPEIRNCQMQYCTFKYCLIAVFGDPTILGKRFTDIAGGTTGWAVWLRNKQMRARKRIPIMSGVTQTKIHQPPFVWVWSSAAQAIFRWHRLHFCSIWTQCRLHIVWKCWDIAVCALKYFSKRWKLVQPCFQW